MVQDIWQYAIDFGWVQWLAVLFNVLYVIFAAREHIWCWIFGLIGVSLLFIIYVDVKLYSDALLQVFYAIMSVYGWISWKSRQVQTITRFTLRKHVGLFAIGTIAALALGYFWQQFGAALPYVDAFTTSFSIVATFLVAKKILENWFYWIIIDLICVVVYWFREIPLISLLFLLYAILAIFGWWSWHKGMQKSMA